jgi:hypothetical protein
MRTFKAGWGLLQLALASVLFLVIMELTAATIPMVGIALPQSLVAEPFVMLINLEKKIWDFLETMSAVPLLVSSFSWLLFLPNLLSGDWRIRNREPFKSTKPLGRGLTYAGALLLASLGLAVFFAHFPYISSNELKGVDTDFYYAKLSQINDFAELSALIVTEARAPYLFILWGVRALSGLSDLQVVQIGPSVPAVLLALSTFLLVREISSDIRAAAIASYLSVTSATTTVGMFAGIYANWLAMSSVSIFLYFLIRILREGRKRQIVLGALAGYATLVIHAWTWGIAVGSLAVLVMLAFVRWRMKGSDSKGDLARLGLLLLSITVPVLVILVFFASFGKTGAIEGVLSGLTEVVPYLSPINIRFFWSNLSFTLDRFVGGFLRQPVLYVLAFIGFYTIRHRSEGSVPVLVSWFAVTSIVTILMDSWFQWRLIYTMPFPILASLGLCFLVKRIDMMKFGCHWKSQALLVGLQLFVYLSLFNYAIRSLSLLPPSS